MEQSPVEDKKDESSLIINIGNAPITINQGDSLEKIAAQLQKFTTTPLYVVDGDEIFFLNDSSILPILNHVRHIEHICNHSEGTEIYIRDETDDSLYCCFDSQIADLLLGKGKNFYESSYEGSVINLKEEIDFPEEKIVIKK